MSLFWKDWAGLKEKIKRRMFHLDNRYQGMSYEQAQPYLDAELSKLTIPDLETFLKTDDLKSA